MVKYCQECGAKLDDDASFCDECGESFDSLSNNDVNASNRFNILIIGLIIILIFAICITCVSLNLQKNTSLVADGSSSFYYGDEFTVTLIDANNNKVFNKPIQLIFTDSNDKTTTFNVTTDTNGVAKLDLDLDEGDYSVEGIFAGDDDYNYASFVKTITIKTKESSYDSSHSTLRETPSSEYSVYDGEYKYFTINIDGEYTTAALPWDYDAGCYHW